MSNIITFTESKEDETPALVRSYVDYSKTLVRDGYSSVQKYAPTTVSWVESGCSTINEWTPDTVKTHLAGTVEGLDEYVTSTDEFLVTALEKTNEFPKMIDQVKSQLSKEELVKLLENLRSQAGSQIREILPSAQLQDIVLRAKVQSLVDQIMSQPEALVEKLTSKKVGELLQNIDLNHDGNISLSDIGGNALKSTQDAVKFCTGVVSNVIPKDTVSAVEGLVNTGKAFVLEHTATKTVFQLAENLRVRWQLTEKTLEPLWEATEMVKAIVFRTANSYAENVQTSFEPLSPYVTKLINSTSVFELPAELLRLAQTTVGFDSEKERLETIEQAKTLFFALIDVSIVLGALKQEDSVSDKAGSAEQLTAAPTAVAPSATGVNVETMDDSEAIKNTNWMKAYSNLECS